MKHMKSMVENTKMRRRLEIQRLVRDIFNSEQLSLTIEPIAVQRVKAHKTDTSTAYSRANTQPTACSRSRLLI